MIGGLDPSGGAGIKLDARVAAACGAHALPVASCLTAQNRHGFLSFMPIDARALGEMIFAAIAEADVGAIKLGMLGSRAMLAAVIKGLRAEHAPVVVDPILGATAGGYHASRDVVAAYRELLVPLAHTITPNLDELARLAPAGGAMELLDLGARHVIVKGGHGEGSRVRDVLVTRDGEHAHEHERLATGPVRGTGCAFATAYAVALARGEDARSALAFASGFVHACLAATQPAPDGLPVPLQVLAALPPANG